MSILLVLFCHSRLAPGFPSFLSNIARQAEVGVTVFFVISGFLITTLLLKESEETGKINVRYFYLRRVLRIVPVYALYTLFILLWNSVEKVAPARGSLIHVLTFTENFDHNPGWFLGHFWSLSVEEQFYLFWPALIILFRRHIKIISLALIFYSCISRIIAYKFPHLGLMALTPFFNYSDAIFAGALGGVFYLESPVFFSRHEFQSVWLQILMLCLFLGFVYCTENGKLAPVSLPFGRTIISFSILFFIVSYLTPSKTVVYRILNNKIIVFVGVLSYSIYVWQEFFFVGDLKGYWRTFPINLPIIFAVSAASYYLWERPFLLLKKYFSIGPNRRSVQLKEVG